MARFRKTSPVWLKISVLGRHDDGWKCLHSCLKSTCSDATKHGWKCSDLSFKYPVEWIHIESSIWQFCWSLRSPNIHNIYRQINFFYFVKDNWSSVLFSYTILVAKWWINRILNLEIIDIYPQKESQADQQWKSPAAVFKRTIVWGFGFSSTPEGRSAASKSNSVKVWGVRTRGGASVSPSPSCWW